MKKQNGGHNGRRFYLIRKRKRTRKFGSFRINIGFPYLTGTRTMKKNVHECLDV